MIDIKRIREADLAAKPGGATYDDDAIKLGEIYDDRSRSLTYAFLKERGLGRPRDTMPLEVSMLRRIVDALSVVYRTPPVRRLVVGARELTDTNEAAQALAHVYARMQVDLHWQAIDAARNLYRQVAVTMYPSDSHRSVQLRVFEPYNLMRDVGVLGADTLEDDASVLFCLRASNHDTKALYQAWMHEDDGSWRTWIVDGRGDISEEIAQPYGESGVTPYGVLPAMLVYDELPRGRAYLPIPQSRASFALAINGLVNDLSYLTQMEAHTPIHVATDDSRGTPTETGPGKAWVTPADARITPIGTNPKIAESGEVLEQMLRLWLTGETLPGDSLQRGAPLVTGAALRVRERDLNARRQRQVALAVEDERRMYAKIAAVHNAYAPTWGEPVLRADAELRATLSRAWQPADPREVQDRMYRDIGLGASSVVDYIQERDGCDRDTAIRTWERVQEDLEAYPAGQNPLAMVDGPMPALGPGSAKPTPGEFNPKMGSSSEGASVLDVIRKSGQK